MLGEQFALLGPQYGIRRAQSSRAVVSFPGNIFFARDQIPVMLGKEVLFFIGFIQDPQEFGPDGIFAVAVVIFDKLSVKGNADSGSALKSTVDHHFPYEIPYITDLDRTVLGCLGIQIFPGLFPVKIQDRQFEFPCVIAI